MKKQTTIYIDDEIIEKLKDNGISNITHFMSELLTKYARYLNDPCVKLRRDIKIKEAEVIQLRALLKHKEKNKT